MSHSSTLVAVVTGSNKGIGFAVVRKLCQEFKGHVYLTARNVQRGQEAIETLKSEGFDPKFHQLDIDSLSSIEELKSFVLEKYGGIDVLVNNAGIAYRNNSTASAIEQAMNTVKTNFTGTLNMMRAFAPIVHEHGRIVNVAAFNGHLSRLSSQSLRDRFSNPALTEEELMALMDEFITDVKEGKHLERGWCSTFYSTSKVGRIALTMVFAREMAKSGVWVCVRSCVFLCIRVCLCMHVCVCVCVYEYVYCVFVCISYLQ